MCREADRRHARTTSRCERCRRRRGGRHSCPGCSTFREPGLARLLVLRLAPVVVLHGGDGFVQRDVEIVVEVAAERGVEGDGPAHARLEPLELRSAAGGPRTGPAGSPRHPHPRRRSPCRSPLDCSGWALMSDRPVARNSSAPAVRASAGSWSAVSWRVLLCRGGAALPRPLSLQRPIWAICGAICAAELHGRGKARPPPRQSGISRAARPRNSPNGVRCKRRTYPIRIPVRLSSGASGAAPGVPSAAPRDGRRGGGRGSQRGR